MNLILLARHGETDWNAAGRWMGQQDIPLNEAGRDQARALGIMAPSGALPAAPALIVASTLVRAAETARIVGECYGIEPRLDERLMESARGEWEGLTSREIEARDTDTWARWIEGKPDFRFPGGESIGEHRKRTNEALAELPENTLVVCHGGTIRCAFMEAAYPHDLKVPNGKILTTDD